MGNPVTRLPFRPRPPHYYGPYPNYANSALPVVDPATNAITGGIRKFIDSLPGLTESGKNNLGQYLPVAEADTTTYPGTDYYEIAVVQYQEKMHSDLPPTLLRGYVQLETAANRLVSRHVALSNVQMDGTVTPITLNGNQVYAVDNPHYMGPIISATKDRPVRLLFRNLLPSGVAGNLFIPVDTTVMGAGMGPGMGDMSEPDPQNPMCGEVPKPMDCFTENRATLHLHGGITPWISDGTPHQWITPADENTPYPRGVSVTNVPDMPDPGPGAMTFFYSNQQSARLLFYHDHSWGITRLNIYAGEAAGYLISDPTEKALVTQGIIPAAQIPLIIQDKTFVPDAETLAMQDPTWNLARWGGPGNLWVPHVYVPAQNPGDSSGVNQFGRWAYGPWFWPPTLNIMYPPIGNPHYDPACNPDLTWCEPLEIPGVPFVSMGMEAFNDTPVVNGTVYPTLTVEPKAYRLRILNAANDRFFNLQLYQADPSGTEVALNAAEVQAALQDPAGVFPTPDLALSPAGPDWIQIGTEGGFLPAPVIVPQQHITWVTDPTVFNAGNVDKHSLLLGPAERADVIVDFSAFAGRTLILYNDAPAAFPARDPRYDYYTGNADLTETGGAPSTLPGYGPNTRTVMQIKVADGPSATAFDLPALQAAFAHKPDGSGVFESSQKPIVVGQSAYNSAYGTSFFTNGPRAGLAQIFNTSLNFDTVAGVPLTVPLEPKAIQDEMGEAFEKEYGRMSGNLGLEAPQARAGPQQNLILYPYVNPPSENLAGIELPVGVMKPAPIASADDGTQIWKITHNGVDTHPIHFHLFDIQLINRVGWDGIIRRPDLNELGWKDTVRISPLEDTIVALRPILPKSPFGLPDSIRPLNPMSPLGSEAMFVNTDANANPINPPIKNELLNFGWEYMWHCHILSHEEMDMMRPITVAANRALPAAPRLSVTGTPGSAPLVLSWTDGTPFNPDPLTWGDPAAEVGYRLERAVNNGSFEPLGTALANQTSASDPSAAANITYAYRVIAFNAAGESPSNTVILNAAPAAPTSLTATAASATRIDLSWTDNSSNESGFTIERATDSLFTQNRTTIPVAANATAYGDTGVQPDTTYYYHVLANGTGGNSGWSNTASATTPAVAVRPAAPSNLIARPFAPRQVDLTWADNSNNESGFVIQRALNSSFSNSRVTFNIGANIAAFSDTSVSPNTIYYYRIRAINAAGNSNWSNTALVQTPRSSLPIAPSNLTATLISSPLAVRLVWSDNSTNETGFVIQRARNATFSVGLIQFMTAQNEATYLDTGVVQGRDYYYRVFAYNANGTTIVSNVATVTTPAARMRFAQMLAKTTSVTVRWAAPRQARRFYVERSMKGTGGWKRIATLPTGFNAYTDNQVAKGKTYYYRVRTLLVNGRTANGKIMAKKAAG